MKKGVISTILIVGLLSVCFIYRNQILNTVMKFIYDSEVKTLTANKYSNNFNFEFVQKTDDFHIKDKNHMLNAIYTVLDSGTDEFPIFCDNSYEKCLDDFNDISKDEVLLSTINNLISPYNSYEKIYFESTAFGKITIKTDKMYSDNDINLVEEKVNSFIANNINDRMSDRQKIKAFHDYVINNSVYDKSRADEIESGNSKTKSSSDKATGPLIDGISLCSGYSDAMKIFLDKLGIPNYKISNEDHIWNLVNIDNSWLHLDLTWDDPVTNTGENILLNNFFLINTNSLVKQDSTGHNFNRDYYKELSH